MERAVAPGTDHAVENRRLIEEWHRTGDMTVLWPGVSAEEHRAAHRQIRDVAEALLRSSGGEPPSLVSADDQETRALGIAGFTSGMGALLGWWIERGRVEASAPLRELFARHLDHGRRRSALLGDALVEVVSAMRAQGVDPIVIKGLHTGTEYFPEPGTRPAADIDLLVDSTDRPTAATALATAGFRESRRTEFSKRSEWTLIDQPQQVHSLELDHADNPWSIDLHTALERWYFRGLRCGLGEDSHYRTAKAVIAGCEMRVLAQPHLTAFLALHASYELVKIRLVRLLELAFVIRRDLERKTLDWAELAGLIEETSTARFLYPALELVEEIAPGTIDRNVLADMERSATRRTRRVVSAVNAANMAPLTFRSLDAKLIWASGIRETLLNLSELLFPSDEGLPVGLVRLYWRRILALLRGRGGWRVRDG